MTTTFSVGLELIALRLVAALDLGAGISASELASPAAQAYSCLEFIWDNKWVSGRPHYSNGNDEGIIFIADAKLTHQGLKRLASSSNDYILAGHPWTTSIQFFEHEGPVGDLTANSQPLLLAASKLLTKCPKIERISIRTGSLVQIGCINLGNMGFAKPNVLLNGKQGFMTLL